MPLHTGTRNWVLTSSQDYEPGQSLCLGQILVDAFEPASGLISHDLKAPPLTLPRDKGWKKNVDLQFNDKLTQSFQAYCQANGAPVGGKAQGSRAADTQATWRLKSLESETFLPSLEYIKTALESGDVRSKTQWWKLRRKIYMVTGLRIARGASQDISHEDVSTYKVEVQADGSELHVPVTVGMEVNGEKKIKKIEKAEEVSDFIFAYRLSEITYTLWVSHKPLTSGHTAASGESNNARPEGLTDGEVDKAAEESEQDEEDVDPDGYVLSGFKENSFDKDKNPKLVE